MNSHDITEILLKVALSTRIPKLLYHRDIVIVDIVVQIYLIPVNCCVNWLSLEGSLQKRIWGLRYLTPLSTIFQLYRGGQFYWWRKPPTCRKSLTNLIT
jgi:hypothetical protein